MKTYAAIAALLISMQTAADCESVDPQSRLHIPASPVTSEPGAASAREDATDYRRAMLECLRPAPFEQDQVVIELEDVADEFDRGRRAHLALQPEIAVN